MIILLTAAAASAFVAFVSFLWSNRAKRLSNAPALATAAQPGIEKTTADRAPGIPSQIQITPDGFFRPDPHPHTDLRTAMTRNFLYACNGLRYPYRMSMAHKQLHVNDWLEIDNEYEYYRARTTGLMEEYGKEVVDCLPEAEDGCNELLQHVVDYLPRRFPHWFTVLRDGILNNIMGRKFEGLSNVRGIEALKTCAHLSQGDYLIANQRDNGKWYFSAALSALPGWNGGIPAKMGKDMFDTHAPVPDFNDKLLKSVERTFTRLAPDQPFERDAAFLATDTDAWLDSKRSTVELSPDFWDGEDMRLRISHQNLRKLPKTKTMVFHILTVFYGLRDLECLPGLPKMAMLSLGDMPEDEVKYTGMGPKLALALPALARMHDRQVAAGMLRPEDDVKGFRNLLPKDQPIPHTRMPWTHETEAQKRRATLDQNHGDSF